MRYNREFSASGPIDRILLDPYTDSHQSLLIRMEALKELRLNDLIDSTRRVDDYYADVIKTLSRLNPTASGPVTVGIPAGSSTVYMPMVTLFAAVMVRIGDVPGFEVVAGAAAIALLVWGAKQIFFPAKKRSVPADGKHRLEASNNGPKKILYLGLGKELPIEFTVYGEKLQVSWPGGAAPRIFPGLKKSQVMIGRSTDNDIIIPNLVVSGSHLILNYYDGHWIIRSNT